ncbi:condensin-2 complex subunit H2 isoform X2 [Genypterus blacodes]|uniref:condensin-2 complex subunit H2 isoform X2 n=1 Tax=Genypterus blacodes TaxID=154954 RepID=UPI003F75A9D4
MESTESKYAHLLQPIRELTKNWDIDVASELNDYLEELDEMCISFDGGETNLNFAEAALLIQGSACIYSKKVELLHSLVYQTLDYFNDKSKKRSKQTAESEEDGDGGGSSNDADDDDSAFSAVKTSSSQTTIHNSDSNTLVSVAPLPPQSLIPPEAQQKHKLPLISCKSRVLGSHQDFRINFFIPGKENLVLLSSASRLRGDEANAEPLAVTSSHQQLDMIAEPAGGDAVDQVACNAVEERFLPLEEDGMEMDQDQGPEEHVDRHQAPSEGRMIRERREVQSNKAIETEMPPTVSVWALHDPYAVLGEDKALKPGKCYRVPDGLDDAGKRKRKQPFPLQDFTSWFTQTFDPPLHKLKNGPVFTDLNYIYLSTMKERLRSRKRTFRRAGVAVSDEELRRTFLQPEEEPVEGLRHPNPLGGDDDHSDNEHEAFPNDIPAEFGGGEDFIPTDQSEELCYEDLVKLCVEQLVVNSHCYTQETALSRRVKDWEDVIRPVLRQQEERATFDIHKYSDRIVGSLGAVGQRRSFASIVAGLDNFEACKYMLASLQLANDYTVEIDCVERLEDHLDTMGMTLLSTHRANDRFKALGDSS